MLNCDVTSKVQVMWQSHIMSLSIGYTRSYAMTLRALLGSVWAFKGILRFFIGFQSILVGVVGHISMPNVLLKLLHLMASVKVTCVLVIFSSSGLLCS